MFQSKNVKKPTTGLSFYLGLYDANRSNVIVVKIMVCQTVSGCILVLKSQQLFQFSY